MTWHPQSYPTRAMSTWPAAPHCHLVAAWCRRWFWRSIIGAACSSNVGHQDTPVVARLVATVSLWCWNFRKKLGEIWIKVHVDALVQEIRNSSAVAMEFRFPCTNPSIYMWAWVIIQQNAFKNDVCKIISWLLLSPLTRPMILTLYMLIFSEGT